jgi:hypothetical protein
VRLYETGQSWTVEAPFALGEEANSHREFDAGESESRSGMDAGHERTLVIRCASGVEATLVQHRFERRVQKLGVVSSRFDLHVVVVEVEQPDGAALHLPDHVRERVFPRDALSSTAMADDGGLNESRGLLHRVRFPSSAGDSAEIPEFLDELVKVFIHSLQHCLDVIHRSDPLARPLSEETVPYPEQLPDE